MARDGKGGRHVARQLTEQAFTKLWIDISSDIADELYPKGCSGRSRGEYTAAQALLYARILTTLTERGYIAQPLRLPEDMAVPSQRRARWWPSRLRVASGTRREG